MAKSLLLAWLLSAGFSPGWSALPAAPAQRDWAVATGTGAGLVLWGGSSSSDGVLHRDGFAYDVAQRSWRPLPRSPLSARRSAASAWTGRELLIWGGVGR